MTDEQWIQKLASMGADITIGPSIRLPGMEAEPAKAKKPKRKPSEMVAPDFFYHCGGHCWTIPLEVHSVNATTTLKSKVGLKASQRRKVCEALGKYLRYVVPYAEAYHEDRRSVRVTMTRLGGRKLDDDNVVGAMKHVRDAVADMMGADDNSPFIKWVVDQIPGGLIGVHIFLELVG